MSQPSVLLVCHAGAGIGLGHLSRCLVVAQALQNAVFWQVNLLIVTNEVISEVTHGFNQVVVHRSSDWVRALLTEQARTKADLVLLDLYQPDCPGDFAIGLRLLRARGCRLVGIDGLYGWADLLHLIYVPSFRIPTGVGAMTVTKVVSGWDCFLLRVTPATHAGVSGRRVLVLTGGSDATGLGASWPSQLDGGLPAHAQIDWVCGPFAAEPCWPRPARLAHRVHRAQPNLNGLMSEVNYAVTLYGVSFFELLCKGLPVVVFSADGSKDQDDLKEIARLQLAMVARDEAEATLQIAALMQDADRAAQLGSRARKQLGDVSGKRLVCELQSVLASA